MCKQLFYSLRHPFYLQFIMQAAGELILKVLEASLDFFARDIRQYSEQLPIQLIHLQWIMTPFYSSHELNYEYLVDIASSMAYLSAYRNPVA